MVALRGMLEHHHILSLYLTPILGIGAFQIQIVQEISDFFGALCDVG